MLAEGGGDSLQLTPENVVLSRVFDRDSRFSLEIAGIGFASRGLKALKGAWRVA